MVERIGLENTFLSVFPFGYAMSLKNFCMLLSYKIIIEFRNVLIHIYLN
jgi:hypothetical protein